MKFLGLTKFVKYLGVQMVACQDIPSEVKNRFFHLVVSTMKKKKNTGRASFEISEAAYSTTGKTIPNPMLHDVKGYQQ